MDQFLKESLSRLKNMKKPKYLLKAVRLPPSCNRQDVRLLNKRFF